MTGDWRIVGLLFTRVQGCGAATIQGGSDGRDVVGGGCMPLLATDLAIINHPWSIHGGFILQVSFQHLQLYISHFSKQI